MAKIITKREKIIFYLTLGVVFFSLIFNFIIFPFLKNTENLNREINFTRAKLKKYLWLVGQKEYLQKREKELFSSYDLSSSGKDNVVSALSELEKITKETNIRLIDIRPQSPRSLDLYKETIVDLRTEGALEAYLKFIYNIEHSLSLLRIIKLELNARPNSQYLEGVFSISQLSVGD